MREICEIRTDGCLLCVIKGGRLCIIINCRQAGRTGWPEESVPARKAVRVKCCLPVRRVSGCEGPGDGWVAAGGVHQD